MNSTNCKTQHIGIPLRNMHTQVEMCSYKDVDSAIEIIQKYIENFEFCDWLSIIWLYQKHIIMAKFLFISKDNSGKIVESFNIIGTEIKSKEYKKKCGYFEKMNGA